MAFDQKANNLFLSVATLPDVTAASKLCCWSVEQPREKWSVRRSSLSYQCLSPDGLLLTGGRDHTLEIRDPASGKLIEELRSTAPDIAFDVRCSADGRHVISGGVRATLSYGIGTRKARNYPSSALSDEA